MLINDRVYLFQHDVIILHQFQSNALIFLQRNCLRLCAEHKKKALGQHKILKEKHREKILHGALQLGPRILSFAALVLFQQGQLISQHGRLLLSMLQSRPQLHAVAFRLRGKG